MQKHLFLLIFLTVIQTQQTQGHTHSKCMQPPKQSVLTETTETAGRLQTPQDDEIKALKNNNALQAEELTRQKFYQRLLGFIAIIIVVFAALILYAYRHLKTINKQLRAANAQVAKQKNTLAEISDRQTQLLKDLKASNAAKDRFFSIIAHDIKNPLQVQLSGTRLLTDRLDALSQMEIHHIAQEMKDNTKHLFDLLDNLLQWASVQTGKIKHQPQAVNLSEIMNRWIAFYTGAAAQKEISLKHQIIPEARVMADPFMVNSILNNLISNALKFTDRKGSITLTIAPEKLFWSITVRDTGVGISQNRLEKLFSIDENVSTRGTKNEKGTGLGMILCREFVAINGGHLQIESHEGQGTTVRFKLPRVS